MTDEHVPVSSADLALPQPAADALIAIERTAVRLAQLAGERIQAALGEPLEVRFKAPRPGHAANSNPVCEVDQRVEALIRAEIAQRHPEHGVLGEESDAPPRADADIVWAIDPVDGTTNYINGLPLFCASIGVLFRGRPVAGAIWCSTSHALRPGVYHARRGGPLRFDEEPVARREHAPWRGLAGEPGAAPTYGLHWDTRVLGSAALECAFVAAGLLQLTYMMRPRIWDLAAGLALAQAAGCTAMARRADEPWAVEPWTILDGFHVARGESGDSLREWTRSVLIGSPRAVQRAVEMHRGHPPRGT